MAWVNRLKWLLDHRDSSRQAKPRTASREKWSRQLKSYCKGLRIDGTLVCRAYESWLDAPAGKKNAWRVADEHGSADALIAEIEREIASRALALRPIKRYRHREPTNGKMRIIGVESVKQQVCDYVAIEALGELLRAKVGFWQVSSVKGKGQLMAANAVGRWVQEGGYFVHLDVRKCYPSIKADVVMRTLRRYVRSPDVLYLCETLLSTYGGGLEIGSYFSLRMAQLVLSFGAAATCRWWRTSSGTPTTSIYSAKTSATFEARQDSCKGCCSRISACASSRGRSAAWATRNPSMSLASPCGRTA